MINVIANTHLKRLRGLFGYKDQVIKLVPCNDIHTWFFRKNIDVAFVKDNKIIFVKRNLIPWKRIKIKSADCVLERYSTNSEWYKAGDELKGGEI